MYYLEKNSNENENTIKNKTGMLEHVELKPKQKPEIMQLHSHSAG